MAKSASTGTRSRWVEAVIRQRHRVGLGYKDLMGSLRSYNFVDKDIAQFKSHTDVDFFCIAANQVLDYRTWAVTLGFFEDVDFTELDAFDPKKIRDLRNMREHALAYFAGEGHSPKRWMADTPDYSVDATATFMTVIGGPLDWAAFGDMAARLLSRLRLSPFTNSESTPKAGKVNDTTA